MSSSKLSNALLVVLEPDAPVLGEDEAFALAHQCLGLKPPQLTGKAAVWAGRLARIATPYGQLFDAVAGLRSEGRSSEVGEAVLLIEHRQLFVDLVQALVGGQSQPSLGAVRVLHPGQHEELGLETPGGWFEKGVVYRAHPADAGFYLPVASYHPFLVEEKEAELAALCAALGAKSASITHSRGASTKADAQASVKVPLEAVDVGASAGGSSSKATSLALTLGSNEPVRLPALPDSLRWYPIEPSWQRMAEARLNDRVCRWGLKFSYRKDFGVNAKLAAGLDGFGLSAGGTFQEMKEVERTLEIEFFAREDYEKAGIR